MTMPLITGIGVAGDIVTLLDGSHSIGSATVDINGNWSVTSTLLAAGPHSLTSTETDIAGNVSVTSAALVLTIDTAHPAAPSTPVLSPASDSGVTGDNTTDATTPVITGTGVTGDTVTLMDGGLSIGSATVDINGAWAITSLLLADGPHSLTGTETDVAGNVSAASAPLVLMIDTVAPVAASTPVLSPASDSGVAGDDITNVTTPVITGTGVVGDTVQLLDGGTLVGTAIVGGDASWSIVTSALADGSHALTTVQLDPTGNQSPASTALTLEIDNIAPAATSLNQTAATGLVGAALVGSTVTLSSGDTTLATLDTDAGGNWGFRPSTLAAGSYTLTARVTDTVGNVSAASGTLAVIVAADHSFTVSATVDGLPSASAYSNTDMLLTQVATQPDASVIEQNFTPSGALIAATTKNSIGWVTQTVTPTSTVRNIYDTTGLLIGTVSEAGSATGIAPANYLTAASSGGASTVTDATPNTISLSSGKPGTAAWRQRYGADRPRRRHDHRRWRRLGFRRFGQPHLLRGRRRQHGQRWFRFSHHQRRQWWRSVCGRIARQQPAGGR